MPTRSGRRTLSCWGNDTADTLFGMQNPIGEDVTIAGMVFTVVGVMDKQKQAFGGGKNPEDNKAFFPVSTFHKIHPEVLDYWISLKFDDQKNKALVQDELTELLRRRRKVPNEAPDNFAIFGTDTLTRLWDNITSGLFLLLFALSSVALLVGGVGVMNIMLVSVTVNIMLVSVTERTREIGVRKAIGASKQTIMMQFTLEAITLCAVGGVIGLVRAVRSHWRQPFVSVGSVYLVGQRGIFELLRDWAGVRHLSRVEGSESESDRSVAV